jgi:Fe-Mn family superoxide dismutase
MHTTRWSLSFDAETMHLHHDKHHQAYVNNLNAAVAAHPELAGKSVEDLLKSLGTIPPAALNAVRNNGGGHFNHSFWWLTLGKGGAAPTGELAKAIDTKFGSLSGFQEKLTAAALSVFGSGWAWLVKLPDGSVAIQTTPNQDATISAGLNPVLGRGCLGACLLSEVPEQARRLCEGVLPGCELGLRERAVCEEGVRLCDCRGRQMVGWQFGWGWRPAYGYWVGRLPFSAAVDRAGSGREASLPGAVCALPRG